MSALGDLLNTVLERGARLIPGGTGSDGPEILRALTADLLSSRGEASGIALAAEILSRYHALDSDGRAAFFDHLAADFDPDPAIAGPAAMAYAAQPCPDTLGALQSVLEPARQELFRRLNMAPGGTAALVRLRKDLRAAIRGGQAGLGAVDTDLRHLLGSWFNRGFLVLRPIDWQSPAAVLEKIIAYEAVHKIDSWDELRRRVEPPDRRCFAFFHPSMPDEPLIFVEVALTKAIPGSIQNVLSPERDRLAPEDATVAVFYSISNCQAGLAGVSFGAFLIKQVARDLAAELPGLETFVTLSPVPGLRRWLQDEAARDPDGDAALAIAGDPMTEPPEAGSLADLRLRRAAARYFLDAKRPDGQPPDPVARFHLGNGAELAAIHGRGDISAKGMGESVGVMVNYHYRLDRIEANHEAYAAEGTVAAAREVRALMKG